MIIGRGNQSYYPEELGATKENKDDACFSPAKRKEKNYFITRSILGNAHRDNS
ncbi:hypothetical protein KAS24_04740 [Candidatus Bathyarchaeota archaeon]|nr:hypothetical protein [Candidatus Bathyarchaeota archaeon]